MESEESAIADVLSRYEAALNASDLEAVMTVYAPDGVFMPQHSPSSVGAEAIRDAYVTVFANLAFEVRFDVAEIRQLAPEWAMARTNSAGTTRKPETDARHAEANQELFLFRKNDGVWKIARYCFSTTNPPEENHGR